MRSWHVRAPFCRSFARVGNMFSESEESEVDWEEVEDEEDPTSVLSELPKGGTSSARRGNSALEITVDQKSSLARKGKKKSFLQLATERFERELRQNMHKVHLLCLLANAMYLNRQCNDELVQALLLSCLPGQLTTVQAEVSGIDNFLKWFKQNEEFLVRTIAATSSPVSGAPPLSSVQVLVTLLRVVGVHARLVLNLEPVPHKKGMPKRKVGRGAEKKKGVSKEEALGREKYVQNDSVVSGQKCTNPALLNSGSSHGGDNRKGKRRKMSNALKDLSDEDTVSDVSVTGRKPQSQRRSSRLRGKERAGKQTPAAAVAPANDGLSCGPACSPFFAKSNASNTSDSDFEPSRCGLAGKLKRRSLECPPEQPLAKKLKTRTRANTEVGNNNNAGPPDSPSGSTIETHKKLADRGSASADVVSSNGPNDPALYDTTGSWVEVFSSKMQKWLTVHLSSLTVGQPHQVELASNMLLLYVVALDADGHIKDVTPRYASSWCTVERKARISEDWWNVTLESYCPAREENEKEDEDIYTTLLSRPLPVKKQEFRGHPLYALPSQLLKYEAVYPKSSSVLGYYSSEPVFSRSCIHTLHCRENWLKEGKVVKKGESPYKVVQSHFIKKNVSPNPSGKKDVHLFGQWQTEEYVPPPVVNGKIPRNEFGNIELFKPSMLPKGASYIRIQGIQKVARKLNIDYASAVVGWEFHGRYSFPVIEGVVVAEENRTLLLDAWREQEAKIRLDKAKKKERVVIDRWRRFVKGVFIAERVKKRFRDIDRSDGSADGTVASQE